MRRIRLAAALALTVSAGLAAETVHQAELSVDRTPAIYRPGEPVRLHYRTRAAGVLVVEDWRARQVRRQDLAPGSGTLDLAALSPGYYEVALGTGAKRQRRALAVLEPPVARSRTFGVMTHFAQGWNTDIIPAITRAGIGTVRDEQYWERVETQPGRHATPAAYARYLSALREERLDVLPILSFGNPLYDGGHTPHSPAARAAFAAYGAYLAHRDRDWVGAVEVWNEINGTFCSGPCKTDRAGTYAALLEDSYAALKADNPNLIVVGGAAVKVPLPWFEALLARGAAQHWDAVAVHPYMEPEDAGRNIAALRRMLDAAGSQAPIWATEFGTGAGRTDAQDRRDTAAYLVRMAVVLRAAGVERLYWYLLRDYDKFKGMGLLRAETDPLGRYAPTAAYAAYATLIRLVDAATSFQREPSDPRTYVYRFDGAGEPVRVMWVPEGEVQVRVELPAAARGYDVTGTPRTLPAGTADIHLDGAPQFLVGAVSQLTERRADVLVADVRDAPAPERLAASARTVEADDRLGLGSNWQAGACVPASPGAACTWQHLTPRATAWEYVWGDAHFPALRVGGDTLHPARAGARPVWAMRRWCAPEPVTLRARGEFTRRAGGDGSGTLIRAGAQTLFDALLDGRRAASAPFDVRVDLARGECLDFIVTPGPGTDLNFDAVGLEARLTRPRGGA